MTKEQFYNHIKEHGVTLARTTEKLNTIPKGTKLYFDKLGQDMITTYGKENEEFNYDFRWAYDGVWEEYTGDFELVDESVKALQYLNKVAIENTKEIMVETDMEIPQGLYPKTINNQQIYILDKSKYTLEQTEDLFIIKVK